MLKMGRLLSDNEGKITQLLIPLIDTGYIPTVKSIIGSFDQDVAFTIIYQGTEEDIPSRFGTFGKRLLRKELSPLEQLASEVNGRNINYLAIPNPPYILLNHLIHVQEGRVIIPVNFFIFGDPKETEKTRQSISDIVNSPSWERNGYTVQQNNTHLINTNGDDLIVFNDTVFVGSNNIIGHYLSSIKVNPYGKVPQKTYYRAIAHVSRGLKELDSERKFQLMSVGTEVLGNFLDVIFTPIDEDTIVVADISYLKDYLPSEIKVTPAYQPVVNQLDAFAERQKRRFSQVVRIPLIPELYSINNSGNEQEHRVFSFISYNNVLQERYLSNGETVHRIYMPTYIFEGIEIPGMDISKFVDLQQQAIDKYKSLGVEVRTIPLPHIIGKDGVLMSHTKVLERR